MQIQEDSARKITSNLILTTPLTCQNLRYGQSRA
ncbi:Uncharacterised protein [Cedecea davisae]|nr:Uncharacterised protein [Cedecea davisae]